MSSPLIARHSRPRWLCRFRRGRERVFETGARPPQPANVVGERLQDQTSLRVQAKLEALTFAKLQLLPNLLGIVICPLLVKVLTGTACSLLFERSVL